MTPRPSNALVEGHTWAPPPRGSRSRTAVVRRIVGGTYLVCAGLNAGLVLADPAVYREFAAASYLPLVRDGWESVVMAHPTTWILLLAAGEVVLGALLLSGSRRAVRLGWAGVIAFQLLLMLFGFGFWLWSLPVLAVLVPLALLDQPGDDRVDPRITPG